MGSRDDDPLDMHSGTDAAPDRPRRAALHRGARIGLVLALLLVVLAAYRLFTPVDLRAGNGSLIRCGSGVRPPSGAFLVNTCGSLVERERTEAVFELIAAAVLAAGALWAFAVPRTTRADRDRPVL